jgi:hypothetical protein
MANVTRASSSSTIRLCARLFYLAGQNDLRPFNEAAHAAEREQPEAFELFVTQMLSCFNVDDGTRKWSRQEMRAMILSRPCAKCRHSWCATLRKAHARTSSRAA